MIIGRCGLSPRHVMLQPTCRHRDFEQSSHRHGMVDSSRTRYMLSIRLINTRFTHRAMSSVSEFVAAALKAEPSLAGQESADQAAIKKVDAETEGLSKDLAVGATSEDWFLRLTCRPSTRGSRPSPTSTRTSPPPQTSACTATCTPPS